MNKEVNVGIIGTGYYVPEKIVTNDDSIEMAKCLLKGANDPNFDNKAPIIPIA